MSDIHQFISELDEYCAKARLEASTVCRRARNNPRLYDRIKNRAEMLDEDIRAIRKWMAENPVDARSEAS